MTRRQYAILVLQACNQPVEPNSWTETMLRRVEHILTAYKTNRHISEAVKKEPAHATQP